MTVTACSSLQASVRGWCDLQLQACAPTISLVMGRRFLSKLVTTSTIESCSLGNRKSSFGNKHTFIQQVSCQLFTAFYPVWNHNIHRTHFCIKTVLSAFPPANMILILHFFYIIKETEKMFNVKQMYAEKAAGQRR